MPVQVCKSVEDAFCHLAEHFLASPAAELLNFSIHTVERPALAKLHADSNSAARVVHKGTVVLADVGRSARLVERELANNLFLDVRVRVCRNDLSKVSNSVHAKPSLNTYFQSKDCFAAL